jgi:hypothetical protein
MVGGIGSGGLVGPDRAQFPQLIGALLSWELVILVPGLWWFFDGLRR